ncbi:hypothetical protein [Burkholderia pseudomultivorans]|uniref:Uncharacterized protein n=1 Tax=Burkholderia pseudomultivorans TaxID=1207504 RepID=A0ABU2ED38_9BURK|nr:hypothetical protein [Burkholderia pseudomultivorans]MDR8731321.1 hypothetical protein [Burkholderia pseudomultivorans]MDR8738942.1 hypothetical protein [Burkholderia pseudomultivorans]MDR8745493.1 hypothetical protein [Burkholderia pseudomultivorans]MDR8757805.1 hypothetical protein [Burkholderia pseudomultivorans]MDR8781905.1 hypothetical protein [Burkholderia pseudomultivorans]
MSDTKARASAQALRFAATLKAIEASVRLGFIDASDDGSASTYTADLTMLVTVAGSDHAVRYQRSAEGVLSIGLADDCGLLPLYRALAALHDEPAPADAFLLNWYYGNVEPDAPPSAAHAFANTLRRLLDETADAEMAAFDAEREASAHHLVMLHVPATRFAEFDVLAADRGLGREGALRRLIDAALRDPSLLDEREGDAGQMMYDGLDLDEEPAPPAERNDERDGL